MASAHNFKCASAVKKIASTPVVNYIIYLELKKSDNITII